MTHTERRWNRRRFLSGAAGAFAGASAAAAGLHKGEPARATGQPAAGQRGPVQVLMETVRQAGSSARGPRQSTGPVVESAFPFTHVGLHWDGDGQPRNPAVRTSPDGEDWSDWHPLQVEAHPHETPRGETFATLVRAPRHRFVQYRFGSGADTGVESVGVTFINSEDGDSLQTADASLTPDGDDTPVHFTREDWGADESLRFDDDGNEIWPVMFVPHKKLVVHHTATTNNYTEDDAKAEVRAIYAYHASTLEWGDIGYNAIVDRFGNVYEGRYGRENLDDGTREVLSTGAVAGHTYPYNYGSSGIALLGTYTARGEGGRPGADLSPGDPAYQALLEMLTFESGRNDLDPEGAGDFALFDWGSDPLEENDWHRDLPNIIGHRDGQSTVCPGGNVYELLPGLRAEVAAALGRDEPAVSLAEYPEEDLHEVHEDDSFSVTYSWDGEADGYEYVLEGYRQTAPGAEEIVYLVGFTGDHRLAWSSTASTSVSFEGLESGHYTLHVRALDADGNPGYRDSRTFLLRFVDEEQDDGDDDNGDGPAAITLEVTGYKVRGLHKADLSWDGATTDQVEVYRDGVLIDTVDADAGGYTDDIDQRGSGTYTYRVCEADGGACSDEVTVEI